VPRIISERCKLVSFIILVVAVRFFSTYCRKAISVADRQRNARLKRKKTLNNIKYERVYISLCVQSELFFQAYGVSTIASTVADP